MKYQITFLATLAIVSVAFAQSDIIPTNDGDVKMTPVLHSTMVLEWKDRTVFIDPYGGAERFSACALPELVIITHAHGDHMDKKTLSGLDLADAELIAPQSVVDELEDIKFSKVTAVGIGAGVTREGIHIEAVPMYNLPDDETSRHKRGWGNGYVITIGGKKFYISGDTEDIPEMRQLQNIDYAFVCMNLPYTMTVEQAADAVLEFKPKVVYPFHYRGQDGFSDVNRFKELVSADKNIEVRLRNWYPE
jgi:L-ascorbate metabolism protein UlaG (beta-lactamase superfamily)